MEEGRWKKVGKGGGLLLSSTIHELLSSGLRADGGEFGVKRERWLVAGGPGRCGEAINGRAGPPGRT
jgi:hypothetical protein